MSDETASLAGSAGSSNPGIDTSERTGTSGTTQGTLASTSSASKHVIQLSPVRRSSYGSSQQEKIESIMNSSPSSPHESSSSKSSSSSSSRKKKRSKSRTKSSGSVCSSKSVETSGSLSVGQQQDVDSNASPPSPGQRGTIHVRQMQWTNPKNNEVGAYTGQVNDLFIPHGHGIMYYTDKSLGVKEGEWKNGRYRRSNYDNGEKEKKMKKRGSSSSRSSSHRSKSKDGKSKKGERSRSLSKSRAHHEQEHEHRSLSRSRVYQQQQQQSAIPRAA